MLLYGFIQKNAENINIDEQDSGRWIAGKHAGIIRIKEQRRLMLTGCKRYHKKEFY